ncbi:MAG: translation initiation factor IF-2 [Proteobacteria bacterium]|nr:translation initiation factor IF-2 [Pseudomonadota bacterium]
MNDNSTPKDDNRTISAPKLQLKRSVESSSVPNTARGPSSSGAARAKTIKVEVRRTRTFTQDKAGNVVEENKGAEAAAAAAAQQQKALESGLSEQEIARLKALTNARQDTDKSVPIYRKTDLKREEPEKPKREEARTSGKKPEAAAAATTPQNAPAPDRGGFKSEKITFSKSYDLEEKAPAPAKPRQDDNRRQRKLTVAAVQMMEEESRVRSMAAERRARDKARRAAMGITAPTGDQEKQIREIVIPESISVQELANRMAVRAVDLVRDLMKLGIMATQNQSIDADTAELLVAEYGHKPKRVTEADVENVMSSASEDKAEDLLPRPPVVTIMGHVDHGKTSLLDAIRSTDVAAGEAGGITQHIGAYQIKIPSGEFITFIDTPGHEAFTSMRARGAKVTDIVILVVAADDGIMPQTIEAIAHAKAAKVPIIVAVNKIDKPGADPRKVKEALLSHELVPEEFGGDVMCVEVSAKQKLNLDKLLETIMLQAEVLELKANPNRASSGTVIEARVDKGRGVVATFLVEKGTLNTGDLVVAGTGYGRVRALLDYKGQTVEKAGPSVPVEVLGLDQLPAAGDTFSEVATEKQAREITEYRLKKIRDTRTAAEKQVSLDTLFQQAGVSAAKDLPVIIKADVQGSVEALAASLAKLSNEEVRVKVVHSAAGGITESDIALAQTVNGIVIGFNVRANSQAKEMASREHIEIRYYSIIYDAVDDIKNAISGLMKPVIREQFIGTALIQKVFDLSKYGKIGGCIVKEGVVKRGAKVRLIRDNVVVHEGKLKTLKRFKDDVSEVKEGFECGMAFEKYEDIKEGDIIEASEIIEEKRAI